MPLMRFDVIEGRSKESLRAMLDAAHRGMVDAFEVPEKDRYQIIHQHAPEEMIIEDTGLGFTRSKDVVLISVTSKQRTEEQKKALYHHLVKELHEQCGISKEDIMISITSNGDADWSFGMGEAQFLTGKL
ncbi:tautomerase family protein [Sinobaca sp. H24]|uniref:tautomerase family protein n=1 Tax=Sinobaca sp. H24 TaxID=2923376 RepID=UPI002079D19E|nr:tautomerase family protein [Sinobaca sp. H24]